MTALDRFKFEDGDFDFPFYNKNPHIPKWGWVVLFIVWFMGFFLAVSDKLHFALMGCIVLIVPVLYFLKWDYKAIFRKPSRRDLLLVVGSFCRIYDIFISYWNGLGANWDSKQRNRRPNICRGHDTGYNSI